MTAEATANWCFYRNADGLMLTALLFQPTGGGRDVAILVPGGYGGLSGPHDWRATANELVARRIAFMIINMRTVGSFLDPHIEDAIPDTAAAVAEAKSRGYDRVVMMGCSLGGPRMTLYAGNTDEPAIRAVVYVNAILSPNEEVRMRSGPELLDRLDATLDDARARVAEGREEEVIVFPNWYPDGRNLQMTARGFLNVYGERDRDTTISVANHAAGIRVPAGIIHATGDPIARAPNAEGIRAALVNAPSVEMIWLGEAVHYWGPGPTAEVFGVAIADWVAGTLAKAAA